MICRDIKKELIDFECDVNPNEQGFFLPGSHIPTEVPETFKVEKPKDIIVLPRNIQGEIITQLQYVRGWGEQFVIAIQKWVVK